MYIVGISVEKRTEEIPEVQEVLTKYGKDIDTRLGIHNQEKEKQGVILVTYQGKDVDSFIEELNSIDGTNVNYMEI